MKQPTPQNHDAILQPGIMTPLEIPTISSRGPPSLGKDKKLALGRSRRIHFCVFHSESDLDKTQNAQGYCVQAKRHW